MSLLFDLRPQIITCIILQRTSINNNYSKYSQQLELNNKHFPAESAFNFYVNGKITDCLGRTVNIKSARENFYIELFQHTNLSRNYSFTPIIKKINQVIERYIQQQFPITYANKGKRRLQTPAVTPKGIQAPTGKKQRIESPIYLFYYHTPTTNQTHTTATPTITPTNSSAASTVTTTTTLTTPTATPTTTNGICTNRKA
ncbi:hypothetical protein G9A89_004193 [Geosiphon pyriformis]|nr:hypothetical protein G9A89_004193 [Geosiphon pyriformis]